MIMTILGCLAALLAFKLLYGWISRPRMTIQVQHIDPPAAAAPTFITVPVVIQHPGIGADESRNDRDEGEVELRDMIDDYYRQHGSDL